jgi:putative transposase
MLHEQTGGSIEMACAVVDLSRSSYYHRCVAKDEHELEAAIDEIATNTGTCSYGTRRVKGQLEWKYKITVSRKRVHRIMAQKGLLRPVKRRICRTTNSQHPYPRYPNLVKELQVTHPEQVWAADITYIRLDKGFAYLAVILDLFTRCVRGWCFSRSLDQELTLTALRRALRRGTPEIHHSDQGVQYAAHAYVDLLRAHHAEISMAAVGKAEENGYAERFMRTIKEEEVDLSEYWNFADAKVQIGHFIEDVYMRTRIHSALEYVPPVEFEAAWRAAQQPSAGAASP